MTMYSAELLGGPLDGQVHALVEDLPSLRFATLGSGSGPIWDKPQSELPMVSDVVVVEYLRTRIVNERGHRWYTYYNPRRST